MRAKFSLSIALLVISRLSVADVLVHDEPSYNQQYLANIERTIDAAKKLAVEASELRAMGTFAEIQTEAINNGFANTVARLARGKEERQNLEQVERSQPARDACDTLTLSAGLDDARCSATAQIELHAADRSTRYSFATGGGISNKSRSASVQDLNAENSRAAAEIIDKCVSLDGKCQDPKLSLFGRALTVEEYRALQLQNDLAANVKIAVPQVTGLETQSPERARAVLEDVRRENAREEARASLEAIQIALHGSLVDGTRAPGRVEMYEDYDGKHVNSQDWICAMTNSCGDRYVSPAEAERQSAEMQAVATSLALDQYKSDLRRERLLQTALLHQLNKVEN